MGLTGDEILSAHDFRDEGECWCGWLSGLILFRLVIPPLHLGVVGSYLIRGAWFPSRFLLNGTDRIQIFGP
jgi:hypothetical protein